MTPQALGFDDDAFAREGFCILRGLWSAEEVRAAAVAFDSLLTIGRSLAAEAEEGQVDRDGSRFVLDPEPFALRRVVWCGGAAPDLARYGADERFVGLAAHVLGARPVVQLIQQAHYKLPGDGVDFAWHQDASNRRYGSDRFHDVNGRGSFVQIVVAVDPMTPSNGPLQMLPGSHRQGFVADPETGRLPASATVGEPVTVELEPGDAAVFGPFVVHGSGPNQGAVARRLFLQGYTLPGANRRTYPGCGTGVTRA